MYRVCIHVILLELKDTFFIELVFSSFFILIFIKIFGISTLPENKLIPKPRLLHSPKCDDVSNVKLKLQILQFIISAISATVMCVFCNESILVKNGFFKSFKLSLKLCIFFFKFCFKTVFKYYYFLLNIFCILGYVGHRVMKIAERNQVLSRLIQSYQC